MPKSSNHQRTPPAETCLLVYEESLVHLGSGRHILLSESDSSHYILDAARLAEAARHLLPDTSPKHALGLFLPAHEFVATRVVMPGVKGDNLYDAVRLQQPMLLPGLTEALLLTVYAPARIENPDHIALWLPTQRADDLFAAFQAQGLYLRCILPRPLAGVEAGALRDEDQTTITHMTWAEGTIRQWLYLPKDDWEEAAFQKQFETALRAEPATEETPAPVIRNCLEDWEALPTPGEAVYRYCFSPPGALLEMQRRHTQRRRRQWQVAAAVLILVLAGAIGAALFVKHRLEAELAALKEQTTDVSRLRAEIFEIEEAIGPVRDFPRQDIVGSLVKLNHLIPKDEINRSWISSFKISNGHAELEGESADPTAILEALEQEESFSDVAFIGPVQGKRFQIGFRLSGVDVEAYVKEYFPMDTY